jgi:hypothetical protein
VCTRGGGSEISERSSCLSHDGVGRLTVDRVVDKDGNDGAGGSIAGGLEGPDRIGVSSA